MNTDGSLFAAGSPLSGVIMILLTIIVIILIVVTVMLSRKVSSLEKRVGKLSAGSDGESLENALIRIFDDYSAFSRTLKQNEEDIEDIYARLRTVIQKIGVIKYDAFNQMGGNLSSAIALLDENNDGFIINTVQSVDGCYSYVKRVIDGKPDIDLGKEENQALEEALRYPQ